VTGPPLDWIAHARVLLTGPDASLDAVAHWLGPHAAREGDGLRAEGGVAAVPAASSVTIVGKDGVPDSLSAWYAPELAPSLAEAEQELGEARELGRLLASPPQVAFPAYAGEAADCFIAATTWDAAELGGERRLFQLILRRDPRA
jgi:hypothetical protein